MLNEVPGSAPATFLFHRGDHRQPQAEIAPGGLSVCSPPGERLEIAPDDPALPTSGRRLALAKWITGPANPLTARVLGPVCEYNVQAAPERYARIAQGLGVDTSAMDVLEAARAGAEAVYRLTDDVGIPRLEELGFSRDEIPMLARIAYDDPQTQGNAREVDVAAYEEIYRAAFDR